MLIFCPVALGNIVLLLSFQYIITQREGRGEKGDTRRCSLEYRPDLTVEPETEMAATFYNE